MGRLLHLSDLHFGRERPELIAPLIALAHELHPDVTVISGDLTQRARAGQYRAAAALLRALPGPVLAVPGNHDMPLWNPLARAFCPFRRWRRAVSPDLEPMAETGDLRVVGLNTADPRVWQRGLIRPAALERATARLRGARAGQLRIVALHHPLDQPPQSRKQPMAGAAGAALALAEAGADVILCGHLHQWAAAPYARREGGRLMLVVQAGTTLSTRLRGEENDLNLIEQDGAAVRVTRYAARGDEARFRPDRVSLFHQPDTARGWQAQPPVLDLP